MGILRVYHGWMKAPIALHQKANARHLLLEALPDMNHADFGGVHLSRLALRAMDHASIAVWLSVQDTNFLMAVDDKGPTVDMCPLIRSQPAYVLP